MSDENSVRAEKLFDKLRALISKNLSDDLPEDDDEYNEDLVCASAEILEIYNEVLQSYNSALKLMDIAISQLSLEKKDRNYNRNELASILYMFNVFFAISLNLTGKLKTKLHETYVNNLGVQAFKQAV